MKKNCNVCKEDKDLFEFYNNKNNIDGKSNYCKKCKREIDSKSNGKRKGKFAESNKKRNDKIKQIIEELKTNKGGKCENCEEKRLHILDFHHLDASQKENQIGNLLYYYGPNKKEIAEKEVEKCILLCSNCHRDFHHLEKYNNVTIKEYLKDAHVSPQAYILLKV